MQNVLEYCLKVGAASPTITSIGQWRELWGSINPDPIIAGTSVAGAVRAGFHADSVAWAFLSGYQAAIRRLLATTGADIGIAPDAIVGFSVSEKSGNSPRDIHTTINTNADGSVLVSGEKTWVIAGSDCDWMIVSGVNQVNHDALPKGASRLDIRLAAVAAQDPGVSIIQNAPTQFIPEVVHSCVRFNAVSLPGSRLLSGDGHDRYVKPFRTLEDIHIAAAILAYLLRCARMHQWPQSAIEQYLSLILALDSTSSLDPAAPTTHLALTGLLNQIHHAYAMATTYWHTTAHADEQVVKWDRDTALFNIAAKTRRLRAERAWSRLQESD